MDWGLTANIAAVVVPCVSAVGWVLDQRIQLAISKNNETLIGKINGTYVKKEVLNARLDAVEAHECHHPDLSDRMAKAERDIVNIGASYARRVAQDK